MKVLILTAIRTLFAVGAAHAQTAGLPLVPGRFRGLYYNPDFETSWFFPDRRNGQRVGLDFTHTVRSPDAMRSVKGTPYGQGCVRVTLAGTMHGPFNGSGYAMDVDTVVAAKSVPEEECFKVVEKFMPFIRSLHPDGGQ